MRREPSLIATTSGGFLRQMPIHVVVHAVPPVHDLVADEAAETFCTNVKRPFLKRMERGAASRARKDDLAAGHN